MTYVISGLDPAPFRHLVGQTAANLAAGNVIRMTADAKPGFPCRVTLQDAEPGETLLLLNHEHLPVDTPYRARHAIFVRENAGEAARHVDAVPEVLRVRTLSVRAFDAGGLMTDADLVEGAALEPLIERMFGDAAVDYLHVHYAKRGCFAAEVRRG